MHCRSAFTVTPGSEQIRATIARDGMVCCVVYSKPYCKHTTVHVLRQVVIPVGKPIVSNAEKAYFVVFDVVVNYIV